MSDLDENPTTTPPTREELLRFLKQCDDNPKAQTWNWIVADLLRHYLELRGLTPKKTMDMLNNR